ncbi:hypothetical protein ACTWPT_32115 [Nonomuraea sp. 3N208]|uniref:hypothetical protein n=1 Tax=Nonomuraea sp. 3N208 TaxID=3457421 RepID=UPI003FD5A5E5
MIYTRILARAGTALALVMPLCTGTVAASAAAGETIFTEHFSNPAGGLPPGWTGSGKIVTDTGYGEPRSLRIDDTSTTAYAGARSKLIAVKPESYYDLTLYTHTDHAGDGGVIRVIVEQFATTPSQPVGDRIGLRWLDIPATRTWRLNTLNFTTAGRAASIRIGLYPAYVGVEHQGRAWFDEPTVTTAASATDPLLDATGDRVAVSSVVDDPQPLSPGIFWKRMPEAPADPAVSERSLWSYPLLRRHFLALNLAMPRVVKAAHDTMEANALDTSKYVQAPKTGEVITPEAQRVVAEDIRYRPIVSPHPYNTGKYTPVYYPRRMQDYLADDVEESLLPVMTLTGDPAFTARAGELLAFLRYSQWTADGDNDFNRLEYPAEFTATPGYRGGWDSMFNWRWLDAYGYTWKLHEPDHHVNADVAKAMVRAFELTGDRTGLDAATEFVNHQIPRYGWHTGLWQGKRYYWTEYNPSGGTNPKLDATDNVQALVARAAAMVGYHRQDRRMLEYARGLLWYCVREWVSDGRWYYDGAENPMNQRASVSHDMAVLIPLLDTTAYLLKAGIGLDDALPALTRAYEYYQEPRVHEVGKPPFRAAPFNRIHDGQGAKLAPEWDGEAWKVTAFFTANRAGTGLTVADIPPTLSPAGSLTGEFPVTVTKLIPPQSATGEWTAEEHTFTTTPDQLRAGVATGLSVQPGDLFRLSYLVPGEPGSWISIPTAAFSFQLGGETRTVRTTVPSPAFPTVVTADTYISMASRLSLPRQASLAIG